MQKYMDELRNRRLYLRELILYMEKYIQEAPKGELRVTQSAGRVQYRHILGNHLGNHLNNSSAAREEKYICKKKLNLAKGLAQRDYYDKILAQAKRELALITDLMKFGTEESYYQTYETMCEGRRRLVEPAFIPEEEYVRVWRDIKYEGKVFPEDAPEIYTENGERVRSKSEKILADKFLKERIPYRYEYPLVVNDMLTIYPDFTVLNKRLKKEFYWEHFGMMDQPEYGTKFVKKMETYGRLGIFPGENLICTFESSAFPIGTRQIENLIAQFLR